MAARRFPIRFDGWYAALSRLIGLPPSTAYVEIDDAEMRIRMGWAFSALVPRSAIASASRREIAPWSRGVHGFRGRWLVNGSGQGIVRIVLGVPQPRRTL